MKMKTKSQKTRTNRFATDKTHYVTADVALYASVVDFTAFFALPREQKNL